MTLSVDEKVLDVVQRYAAAGRHSADVKQVTSLDLFERQDFGLSAEVMQQFYVTVTSKLAIHMSPEEASEWIE